jgi:IS5 family transposase
MQDEVPDESTLVRLRQRLRKHGLHEQLLGPVNAQLQSQGLILKICTLVDATLLQAVRRAPAKGARVPGMTTRATPSRQVGRTTGTRRAWR